MDVSSIFFQFGLLMLEILTISQAASKTTRNRLLDLVKIELSIARIESNVPRQTLPHVLNNKNAFQSFIKSTRVSDCYGCDFDALKKPW